MQKYQMPNVSREKCKGQGVIALQLLAALKDVQQRLGTNLACEFGNLDLTIPFIFWKEKDDDIKTPHIWESKCCLFYKDKKA